MSNGVAVPTQIQLSALGDTAPTMYSNAMYYPTTDLALANLRAAYGQLYRSQLWIGVVVRKIAMLTARIPLEFKIASNLDEQAPMTGPLVDLLARPNPRLSGFGLWRWTAATRSIYGEAFWLKVRDSKRQVRELHPMHPVMTVVRRLDDGSLGYQYLSGGSYSTSLPTFAEKDVVAFVDFNPDTMNRGMSKLESLRATLANEDASRRAQSSFWQKGARPSVVLTHPNTLSDGAAARIRAGWEASQGGADNMGGTAILEEGLIPHVLQLSSEDMQYIEGRKLNREEVAAAYDIPPPSVHILDHATYSNITEGLRSVYRDTMAPEFAGLESVLDSQLIPDFYPSPDDDVFARFNLDDVLRGDFEARALAVTGLVEKGVLTPNEARPMFGKGRFDDPMADKLFASSALVPLGAPATRVSVTAAAPATGAQQGEVGEVVSDADATAADSPTKRLELEAAPPARRELVRAIRGRVNQKGRDQRAALVEEHAKELRKFFAKQGQMVTRKAFDPTTWDAELSDLLETLGSATALQVGGEIAKGLGGSFSLDGLSTWLKTNCTWAAQGINAATATQIQSAIDAAADDEDDPDEDADPDPVGTLFAGPIDSRADQIASTRVSTVSGASTVSAGRQNGASKKTWVTGPNPRPEHQAMDGETVGVDDNFSNGAPWPGASDDVDSNANCNCSISFD